MPSAQETEENMSMIKKKWKIRNEINQMELLGIFLL